MGIEYIEVDRVKSRTFADTFRGLIKPNQCYDNIANISLSHPHIEKSYPGIQISYGGIQIFPNENLYARHIVFLLDGKAIDPTLAVNASDRKERIQYIPILTLGYPAYMEFIREHQETSPAYVLREMDRVATEWLKEDIFLVG